MTIQRMDHVGIVVDDLAAARGPRPQSLTVRRLPFSG
jgi:hypothetical protein